MAFLRGKSHGQRSLVGYSPWCCQESDTTTKQEQRLGMEGIWQVEKDVLNFMFHHDYVASFRCFKTSESILLPSRSSASPLNSHW